MTTHQAKTFRDPDGNEYQSTSDSGCQGADLNECRCESTEGDALCPFEFEGRVYLLCAGCHEAWAE
jgi:hypothetical protein